MTHARQVLRDAAKAALSSGVPAVSGRVAGVRAYAYGAGQLPALEVSTPAMSDQRISDDGDIERTFSLEVRVIHAVSEDAEDACDALAEKVEAAIYGLAGAWAYAVVGASSDFFVGDPGEKKPAVLATVFTLRAYADEADPQQT